MRLPRLSLRALRARVDDVPIRFKMTALAILVLGAFGLSLAMNAYLDEQVRIGGTNFDEIEQIHDLMVLVAHQKSDLNEVRAELAGMVQEAQNLDAVRATREAIGVLRDAIEARFDQLLALSLADEKRLAIEDARATWLEFYAEIDQSIVPALEEGRAAVALRIVRGVQHRRSQRFGEQIGALAEMSEAEMEQAEEEAMALSDRLGRASLAVNGFAFAVVLLVLWSLTRSLTGRIERLSAVAQRVATGDLTEVPGAEAAGDEVGRLQVSLGAMVERLRTLVAALKSASDELSGAATILDQSTENQTQLLQQQAGFLTEVGATTKELEQTSSVASQHAETVLGIARDASDFSRSGEASASESLAKVQDIRQHMRNIVARSGQLGEQARQVGEIVESVKEIASQSQILSLNASIEAARAGEAGRGFAVVAHEVRALAEQSGQSATRIGKIVQDIARAVAATVEMTEEGNRGMEAGIDRIRASGESLKEIGSFIGTTSEAALQIAGAVKQQSAGVAQIAAAIADLDVRMKEAVRGIHDVRQAAAKLTATSGSIRTVMSEFRA